MAEGLRRLDPARLVEHVDRLYASACRLCGDPEWAEDLVQETYARVLARPRVLRKDDDLGYLLRALRNTFFVQLKTEKRQHRGEVIDAQHEPVDAPGRMTPERAVEMRAVYAAIAQLPDDFRFVVVAIDVTGLSYEEAGRALRIPEGTVRSRLFRARDRIADLLDGQAPGAEIKQRKRNVSA